MHHTGLRILVSKAPGQVLRYVSARDYKAHLGCLATPHNRFMPDDAITLGAVWACDNNAFTGFDARQFVAMLQRHQGKPRCLFVAVPDVVGDARATLRRFRQWRQAVVHYGYRPALVAQDGLEHELIPWPDFDTLFIGGSTAWKLGEVAAEIVREAKERGKWVHMGRVNTDRRLQYAAAIGCDSCDGTGYARYVREELVRALPSVRHYNLPLWENLLCS